MMYPGLLLPVKYIEFCCATAVKLRVLKSDSENIGRKMLRAKSLRKEHRRFIGAVKVDMKSV